MKNDFLKSKSDNPFGGGLFGKLFEKQKTLYVRKVNYPIRPIEQLARELVPLTDEQWGEYAFHRDPIGAKFTAVEKQRLIRLANECGREYAQRYRTEDGYCSPEEIAQSLGVEVKYPHRPSSKILEGNRVLFAQFTTPDHIDVFTDCTDKAEPVFSSPTMLLYLGRVDIRSVLLCHELFHFFEETDAKTIFTENERKTLTLFGFIKNRSRIMCLGEIAAMQFVKTVLGLSYSPYVFDVLLTYPYDKQVACNLNISIRKLLFPDAELPQPTDEHHSDSSNFLS